MMTLLARPVTSSISSWIVTSLLDLPVDELRPATSVRIGVVYGSHSTSTWPAVAFFPSRTLTLAPYTTGYRSFSRPLSSTTASSPFRFMTTRSPSRFTTVRML